MSAIDRRFRLFALGLSLVSAWACTERALAPEQPCGVVRTECRSDRDCCRFLRCEEGACAPKSPPPASGDAGTGSADGGGADADAGMDELDGGLTDIDAGGDPMTPPDPSGDAGYWERVNVDGGTIGAYAACVGTPWPVPPSPHIEEPTEIAYDRYPPASGPHWPCWAPWVSSTRELPPERFVHNLEHSGVVLLYRCGSTNDPDGGFACADDRSLLEAFVAAQPADVSGQRRYVVSSSGSLATRYAAVAWGWTLETETFDAAAFACFASAHLEMGPENTGMPPSPDACPQVYLP